MDSSKLIQAAIARADMALVTAGNCFIVALPVAALTFAVIVLCRFFAGRR